MPATTHPMSVAEVSELPHDSWINDGFTAVVRTIERKVSKTQKPFWKCKLADTTGSAVVGCTMFTAPKFKEGQIVDFLGQGIKFKNDKYGPEVSISDKTEIHPLGMHVRDQEPGTPGAGHREGASEPTPKGDFHKAMKRQALLYLHCLDYASQIQKKDTGGNWRPELHQACVSSLYIEANRKGLDSLVPPLGAAEPAKPSPAKPAPPAADDSEIPF